MESGVLPHLVTLQISTKECLSSIETDSCEPSRNPLEDKEDTKPPEAAICFNGELGDNRGGSLAEQPAEDTCSSRGCGPYRGVAACTCWLHARYI